ncbi:hypothetical protein J6590_065076 [Homalodisca vitripennis]|nr:hypothetical protein J6590_065076 [Homalodisca vitripennis]
MLEVRPITRDLSCIISYSPLPAHNRVHKVRVKLTACYITWINVRGSTHNQRALMCNILLSSPCPQQKVRPITRELSCVISYSPLPAHNRVHKVRVKLTAGLSCVISYSPLPAHNRVHKVRVKLTACYITWIHVRGSTHNQRALMCNILLSSPCPQQSAQSSGQADGMLYNMDTCKKFDP